MPLIKNSKAGVSNIVFAVSIVVLVIIAGSGFGLYATSITHTTAMTSEMMTTSSSTTEMMSSSMMSSSMSQNGTCACAFVPKSGAMISNAWLISAPLHMSGYAVAIHAEGLEPNGTYLVEGALTSGAMQVVPISNESMTMTHGTGASEFQANANGTGNFWIELGSNPMTTFEQIDLLFLPGMSMQNATVVATVSMTSMMTSMTTTMSMTSMSTSG